MLNYRKVVVNHNKNLWRDKNLSAYLYILPAFLFFSIFILLPIFNTLRYSFTNWNGFTERTFIGLRNYVELLTKDKLIYISLCNNLKLLLFYTLGPIVLGLFLTALLTLYRVKGFTFFRVGLFIPYVMAGVTVGVIWKWIYHPALGPINYILRSIGLEFLAKPWLGNVNTVLPSVGIMAIWMHYGFAMVIFLAAVQRIDESLYDAGKVDGANVFRLFWHVTLPSIRNEIMFVIVVATVNALRLFDLTYIVSGGTGGPANRTLVMTLYLIRSAFQQHRVGYASAIAVFQMIILGLVSGSIFLLRRRVTR